MAEDDDTEQGPGGVEQRDDNGLWDEALHAVTQTAAFCDNATWQDLYQWMQNQIDGHKHALETAEKMAEVIHHQSAISTLRTVMGHVLGPVTAFNALYEGMPLFDRPDPISVTVNEDGTISVVYADPDPETQEANE